MKVTFLFSSGTIIFYDFHKKTIYPSFSKRNFFSINLTRELFQYKDFDFGFSNALSTDITLDRVFNKKFVKIFKEL